MCYLELFRALPVDVELSLSASAIMSCSACACVYRLAFIDGCHTCLHTLAFNVLYSTYQEIARTFKDCTILAQSRGIGGTGGGTPACKLTQWPPQPLRPTDEEILSAQIPRCVVECNTTGTT